MSLPKIEYPIHNIKVPSLQKNVKFRPFLVKEEKLLLMAKETGQETEYLSAIKQVIGNCCLEKYNVDTFTTFDLEYIFLKLRSYSVDNIVKMSFIDNEDQKTYDFEIDLSKIEVKLPEKNNNNIKINKNVGIIMKYPSAELFSDNEFLNSEEQFFDLIIKCVDKIYEGDNIFETKNYKKQDISTFLENLDLKTFESINEFLSNTPKLYHEINYKNSLGNTRKIEFNKLSDFFP